MDECRYKGQCRIEYDTDFDVCYPCIGDGSEACAEYEPMPDVDALEALADEMEGWALTCDHYDRRVAPIDVARYAARIREACGGLPTACHRPRAGRPSPGPRDGSSGASRRPRWEERDAHKE